MIGSCLSALATTSYDLDATRTFLASSLPHHTRGASGTANGSIHSGSGNEHHAAASLPDSELSSEPRISCLTCHPSQASSSQQPLVVVQLNREVVRILDLDLIKDKLEILPHRGNSSSAPSLLREAVVLSPSNPFHLWMGDTAGIGLYDLRMHRSKPAMRLTAAEPTPMVPLSCFDVNADETLIAAGCELGTQETCLQIWDVRSRPGTLRDSYADSHTEEVSAVRFHPIEPSTLVSGGMDGLVNTFDLSEGSEDDALQMTLKVDETPHRIRWDPNTSDLMVIMEDGSLQVLNDTDVEPVFHMRPNEIDSATATVMNGGDLTGSTTGSGDDGNTTTAATSASPIPSSHPVQPIKMSKWGHVVDTFLDDDEIHVVMSTALGVMSVWRLTENVSTENNPQSSSPDIPRLVPCVVGLLDKSGHRDRIRAVCHLPCGTFADTSLLITGGDDGILSVWRENNSISSFGGGGGGGGTGTSKVRRESGSSVENGHGGGGTHQQTTTFKRVRTLSTNSTGSSGGGTNGTTANSFKRER